jgi:hypothetical protein
MLIFLSNRVVRHGFKEVSKQISKTVLTPIVFPKEKPILEQIGKKKLKFRASFPS